MKELQEAGEAASAAAAFTMAGERWPVHAKVYFAPRRPHGCSPSPRVTTTTSRSATAGGTSSSDRFNDITVVPGGGHLLAGRHRYCGLLRRRTLLPSGMAGHVGGPGPRF